MRTVLLSMMVMTIGCGGISVRVLDPRAASPSALAVETLTLDQFTPKSAKHERTAGLYETHLVAEALRAGGAPIVEAPAADYVLCGKVERAAVDEWVSGGAFVGNQTADKVHFLYVHYEISLELKDKQGRAVARAKSEVDDVGRAQFEQTLRATVRELVGALRPAPLVKMQRRVLRAG